MSTIRLELHIDTAGSAFGAEDEDEFVAQHELARLLRDTADKVLHHGYELNGERLIIDANGNRCGHWVVTDAPVHNARSVIQSSVPATKGRPVGPCPCECNRGGFCGGCGHAGCGGRR